MKRRALPWNPVTKCFTEKSEATVPRLLDPEEEELAREYLAKTPADYIKNKVSLLQYMNAAVAFKNW